MPVRSGSVARSSSEITVKKPWMRTTYSDRLSDVRAEFGKRYPARGTISASEVACLTGFIEPPAFFKAFERWTEMTPREFAASRA
jgi:AraC-like DNA-binding protein